MGSYATATYIYVMPLSCVFESAVAYFTPREQVMKTGFRRISRSAKIEARESPLIQHMKKERRRE